MWVFASNLVVRIAKELQVCVCSLLVAVVSDHVRWFAERRKVGWLEELLGATSASHNTAGDFTSHVEQRCNRCEAGKCNVKRPPVTYLWLLIWYVMCDVYVTCVQTEHGYILCCRLVYVWSARCNSVFIINLKGNSGVFVFRYHV